MLKHILPLHEPQRGKDFLIQANEFALSQDRFVANAPVFADGIVLTFPFILLFWYIKAIVQRNTVKKIGALYVAASAFFVAVTNMVIQFFVDKQRPEGYIGNTDMLIMDHLPTAPFPSDHAAVGAAVACAALYRAYHHDMPFLRGLSRFLLIGGIVMSMSRVMVGIHWPTDVIVGFLLGALVAVTLGKNILFTENSWVKRLLLWGISVEEAIVKKIFGH